VQGGKQAARASSGRQDADGRPCINATGPKPASAPPVRCCWQICSAEVGSLPMTWEMGCGWMSITPSSIVRASDRKPFWRSGLWLRGTALGNHRGAQLRGQALRRGGDGARSACPAKTIEQPGDEEVHDLRDRIRWVQGADHSIGLSRSLPLPPSPSGKGVIATALI